MTDTMIINLMFWLAGDRLAEKQSERLRKEQRDLDNSLKVKAGDKVRRNALKAGESTKAH